MKRNRAEQHGGHGKCIVCSRPDRDTIDAALATSSLAAVSAAFGIGISSLHRHRVKHAPGGEVLTSAPDLPAVDEGTTHASLVELVASCKASLEEAKRSRSLNQIAVHHREYRQALDDLHAWEVDAELLELKRHPPAQQVFNVLATPAWRETTVALFRILAKWPEVRIEVSNELDRLEKEARQT